MTLTQRRAREYVMREYIAARRQMEEIWALLCRKDREIPKAA